MARLSRAEQRFITKEKIKRAALKQFSCNGFAGAAIDRIAEEAGFSRGAFYSNYQNKEEILLELLHDQHKRDIEKWQASIDTVDDIEATYKRMLENFIPYLKQENWGLFNIEVQLHAKRNPDFSKKYLNYVDDVHQNIATSLQAMFVKARHKIPANISSIAALVHNLVIGIILDTHNDNSDAELRRCAEQLIICIRSIINAETQHQKTTECISIKQTI